MTKSRAPFYSPSPERQRSPIAAEAATAPTTSVQENFEVETLEETVDELLLELDKNLSPEQLRLVEKRFVEALQLEENRKNASSSSSSGQQQ